MRIAYVINSVEGGGAASPVPAVTRVLRDAGAEVRVFALTRRDGRGLAAMEASGLTVEVRDGGERDHLAAFRWLDGMVAGWRPTHLWTSLTRATLLGQQVGRRRGLPVVSWQHSAVLKPANELLLRATHRLSAMWVGDSQTVTDLTAARLRVPRERLATWPIFAADPAAPVATPWRPGEPLRIGSLGRLHPVKGYDVLIGAVAKLKAQGFALPFELTLGGDGAERERLAALAREAGLTESIFAGYIDRPRDFLSGLHLYAQPSRHEGFCVAAHEAMQAGLPVVASAVGELPQTVTPEVGWLAPPGDVDALARALGDALERPEQLTMMGATARARVLDRFSQKSFADAGRSILRLLVS